jgi:hypothetical protein
MLTQLAHNWLLGWSLFLRTDSVNAAVKLLGCMQGWISLHAEATGAIQLHCDFPQRNRQAYFTWMPKPTGAFMLPLRFLSWETSKGFHHFCMQNFAGARCYHCWFCEIQTRVHTTWMRSSRSTRLPPKLTRGNRQGFAPLECRTAGAIQLHWQLIKHKQGFPPLECRVPGAQGYHWNSPEWSRNVLEKGRKVVRKNASAAPSTRPWR